LNWLSPLAPWSKHGEVVQRQAPITGQWLLESPVFRAFLLKRWNTEETVASWSSWRWKTRDVVSRPQICLRIANILSQINIERQHWELGEPARRRNHLSLLRLSRNWRATSRPRLCMVFETDQIEKLYCSLEDAGLNKLRVFLIIFSTRY
jgi:hypothetical protein